MSELIAAIALAVALIRREEDRARGAVLIGPHDVATSLNVNANVTSNVRSLETIFEKALLQRNNLRIVAELQLMMGTVSTAADLCILLVPAMLSAELSDSAMNILQTLCQQWDDLSLQVINCVHRSVEASGLCLVSICEMTNFNGPVGIDRRSIALQVSSIFTDSLVQLNVRHPSESTEDWIVEVRAQVAGQLGRIHQSELASELLAQVINIPHLDLD